MYACRVQDTFGKSDPFYRLSRLNEDGTAIPMFKSEVIMKTLNPTVGGARRLCDRGCRLLALPGVACAATLGAGAGTCTSSRPCDHTWANGATHGCLSALPPLPCTATVQWKPATTSMQMMCNGDPYRPVLLEVFDWNKDGTHDLIGSATTSVDDLNRRATSGDRLPLVHKDIKAKKGAGYTHSGLLRVMSFVVTPRPSFLDFITHGCELSFMVRPCCDRCAQGCPVWSSGPPGHGRVLLPRE